MAGTAGDNYITLTWLNTRGSWEYWTFTARHSYGYNVESSNVFETDIFQNWDTDFISGQEDRRILRNKARATVTLRSQRLTKEQANAIARMIIAKKVQDASDFRTVIVQKGSLNYRTDKDKTITLEFNISYPQEQIQTG